jgi:hypothetical protein
MASVLNPTDKLTGALFLGGAALWAAAGTIGGEATGAPTTRFWVSEVIWLAAQVALLGATVALRRMRLHGERRLGRIGFGIAILGRAVFVAAEILSIIQGKDENLLLPAGALLSSVGMICAGIAIVGERRAPGWSRWGVLAFGLYPFLVMFPIVATTGAPSVLAITLWGLFPAGLGVALLTGRPARG